MRVNMLSEKEKLIVAHNIEEVNKAYYKISRESVPVNYLSLEALSEGVLSKSDVELIANDIYRIEESIMSRRPSYKVTSREFGNFNLIPLIITLSFVLGWVIASILLGG